MLNNSIKTSINIEVQSIFDNEASHRNNKYLSKLSGEYKEIPPILTINKSVHKYLIEEIFFILTTNTKRIFTMIHFLKFWANLPGSNCLILLEEMNFMNYRNITEYLMHEGILCEVQTSTVLRYEERYFELLYRAWNKEETDSEYSKRKRVQWFAV